MNRLLSEINVVIQRFEAILPALFGRHPFPPGSLGLLVIESPSSSSLPSTTSKPYSISDLLGDGFLWAVPKHRRSVERRMQRRIGNVENHTKMLQTKKFLVVCEACGNYKEVAVICAHCYDKVRKETESIKDKIMAELQLKPDDKEVVVLYDGEKVEPEEQLWEGKRIVEMEKPRPMWFSRNLMQKSTQPNATTKDVKPDELG